jgi:tetratricopeptide (TPR) repeat protein
MNFFDKPTAVVAIATCLACASAQATEDGYEAARRATRSALEKQEKGLWNDALADLERAAQACGRDEAGRSCRLLVQYSQGYLFERQARRASENSAALLASAEERYLAVLAETPQHEPTLKNLALIYRELGRRADAERLLQRAVEADRSGTGRAAMLLGQSYRDAGDVDAALSSYERAAAANPADAAAPMAIVASTQTVRRKSWPRCCLDLPSGRRHSPRLPKKATDAS